MSEKEIKENNSQDVVHDDPILSDGDSDSDIDLNHLRRKENDEETDLTSQENEPQSGDQTKNEQTTVTKNEGGNDQFKKYNRSRYNDKRRYKSKGGHQKPRGGGNIRGGHQKPSNYRNRNKDSKKPKDNRTFNNDSKPYYGAQGQNRRQKGGRRKNFDSYNKPSPNDDIKPLDPNSPPFTPTQFYPPYEMFNSLSISNQNEQ